MRRLTTLRAVYSIILFAEAAMGAITVSVSPAKVTLSAGQTQQFTATLSGAKQGVRPTGVSWTISPAIGTITASALSVLGAPADVAVGDLRDPDDGRGENLAR